MQERKPMDDAELVQLEFLQRVSARLPEDFDVLRELGDLCTKAGLYERGLEIDEQLSRLRPEDASVWYNLGCSLALCGKKDEALRALAEAVRLGYSDHEWMKQDNDLRRLRNDRRFRSLLGRIKSIRPV